MHWHFLNVFIFLDIHFIEDDAIHYLIKFDDSASREVQHSSKKLFITKLATVAYETKPITSSLSTARLHNLVENDNRCELLMIWLKDLKHWNWLQERTKTIHDRPCLYQSCVTIGWQLLLQFARSHHFLQEEYRTQWKVTRVFTVRPKMIIVWQYYDFIQIF